MRSENSALSAAIWPSHAAGVARLVLSALVGSALITLSAKVQVPFWPVPMTLATFAVMAIAAACGRRVALAAVIAYIAEGMAGLPVFSSTPPQVAGPAYMVGPTAGYIWGYLAAAFIVGTAADKGWGRSPLKLGAAMLVGDAALFAIGLVWLGVSVLGFGPKLYAAGLAPFVLGDLVKIALAAALIPAGWALLDRRRG